MPGGTPTMGWVAAMPSEVVYGSSGGVDVRVSWATIEEGTVQVVSQAVKTGEDGTDPVDRVLGIVNGWLKAADMATIDAVELRRRMPFEPSFNGWWATLTDWAQVNRLIKALKRARDRQFGDPA